MSNSISSEIIMLHFFFSSCDFAFSQELDLGNCCNISDVASKYSIRGAIFHDGEEVNSGVSILIRLLSVLCMISSSKQLFDL